MSDFSSSVGPKGRYGHRTAPCRWPCTQRGDFFASAVCLDARQDGAGPPKERPEGDPAKDTLRDGRIAVHPPNG